MLQGGVGTQAHHPLNEPQAKDWIDQAQSLLARAESLAQ